MKEARSFETDSSLTKIQSSFDKIILSDSESDFGHSGADCNESLSTTESEIDTFKRIMNWFKQKNIHPGCPESLCHSFICKQRESVKLEE